MADNDATKDPGGSAKTPEEKVNILDILTLNKQIEVARTNVDGLFSSLLSSYQELERQAAIVAKSFGGTKLFSEDIKRNIAEAGPSVVQLGGKLSDVANMQLSVMTNLGTQAMFNSSEFANLYGSVAAVSSAGEDIGKKTGEITKKFVDAGYSIHAVSKELLGIVNSAIELGAASEAVFAQVSKNIEKVDMYHFEGGVKGMAEMAAQSTLLRIDMTDTLDVARKLFKPEEAIKMSAQFQQLGVSVSELLDPIKLMDMARNAPKLLQEKLGQAFSQLTKFNEETGKMEVPSGAVDFFISLGDTLGKTPEQLMQWGKSVGDLSLKMKAIKFSPDFEMDEKMQERIASLSYLATEGVNKGKYVIEFGGKELLSEGVGKEFAEQIKKASEPAKSGAQVAADSLDVLRSINGVLEAQRDLLALQLVSNKNINAGIRGIAKGYLVGAKTQAEVLGMKPRDVGGTKVYDVSGIGKTIETGVDKHLMPIMEAMKNLDFNKAGTLLSDFGKDIAKGGLDKLQSIPDLMSRIAKEEGVSLPDKWVQMGSKLMGDLTGATSNIFSMVKNSDLAKNSLLYLHEAADGVATQFDKIKKYLSENTKTEEKTKTGESKYATPTEEAAEMLRQLLNSANPLTPKSTSVLSPTNIMSMGTNVGQSVAAPLTTTNTFDLVPQRVVNSAPLNYSPSAEINELSLSNAMRTPSEMNVNHNHTFGGDIVLKADGTKVTDLVRNMADDRSFVDSLSKKLKEYNSDWDKIMGGKK